MLGKLIWDLHRDCDFLWIQVLKHKYTTKETFNNMKNKSWSITWNAIMKNLYVLKDEFKFRLGDVNSSFWFFNWFGVEKLVE